MGVLQQLNDTCSLIIVGQSSENASTNYAENNDPNCLKAPNNPQGMFGFSGFLGFPGTKGDIGPK